MPNLNKSLTLMTYKWTVFRLLVFHSTLLFLFINSKKDAKNRHPKPHACCPTQGGKPAGPRCTVHSKLLWELKACQHSITGDHRHLLLPKIPPFTLSPPKTDTERNRKREEWQKEIEGESLSDAIKRFFKETSDGQGRKRTDDGLCHIWQ